MIKIENTDEITMMSCNLRCLTPVDFGKKSWFYRAELVMEGIENNTYYPLVAEKAKADKSGCMPICAKIEEDVQIEIISLPKKRY